MSKKKKKESKPTSSYKIGDRTVAQTYWNGNDYVTKYNPTDGEQQSISIRKGGTKSTVEHKHTGGSGGSSKPKLLY